MSSQGRRPQPLNGLACSARSGPVSLCLPLAGVSLLDHEIPAVTVQERAVQDNVVGVQIDVRALGHGPVLVIAQEEVLAPLVEELALDTLAPADALAERGQKLLLSIPADNHVLVRPCLPVRYSLALWCAGYQLHDVRPVPRRVLHRPSSLAVDCRLNSPVDVAASSPQIRDPPLQSVPQRSS